MVSRWRMCKVRLFCAKVSNTSSHREIAWALGRYCILFAGIIFLSSFAVEQIHLITLISTDILFLGL
jgi:hypothetical protein